MMESRSNLKNNQRPYLLTPNNNNHDDADDDDVCTGSSTRKCSLKNLKKFSSNSSSSSSSVIKRSKSLHETKSNGHHRSIMMKNHQSQQQEQQMKINCRKYPIITTNNNQNINLTINGHHDEENQFEEQSLNSVKKFVRTNNLSSNHHGKQQPTSKKMTTKTTTGNHRTATRTQSFNNNHDLHGSFSSGTSLVSSGSAIFGENNLYHQMSRLSLQQDNNSSSNNSITTTPATYNGYNDLHEIESIFLNCDVYGDVHSDDSDDINSDDDDDDNNFYGQNLITNNKPTSLSSSSSSWSKMSIHRTGSLKQQTTDQTIIGYGKSMDKKRFKSKRNKNGKIPYNHRFYLIKQQNYPPLYLDNSCNRKRIYRIIILGYPNVGKSSLIKQFRMHLQQTSETSSFNPANCNEMNDNLNLFIHFLELDSMIEFDMNNDYNCVYHSQRILKSQHQQQQQSSIIIDYQPDVYLIMFSVNDRESFNHVRKALIDIQRWDDVENKIIIIVANKCDLERSRCVNRKEARELATENNCKYIEISCTISHNIDTLLEGIGAQITLKNEQEFNHNQQHHQNHHHNHNNSNYPQQQQQQNRIEIKNNEPINNHYHHHDEHYHRQHHHTNQINHNDSILRITNGKSSVGLKRRESFLKRILRKAAMSKSKSCDNLHVL
ncbi:hypothetical protein DERF_010190 [Dermatophagoides farinae]|uniref:Uncharacterized protein n=1 Tax=Dermatophagoides farinae TaxID=6954 RepID=A0A922HVJ9_DERFA|nr:hypothetical protein DERF_010190 [Dermatophagoides farinae]